MKILLRACAALLCVAGAASALAGPQAAGPRPIRLLVGAPAASEMDVTTRALAASLARELGRPVAVENRPGAGGARALAAVARAAPDGATLAVGDTGSLVLAPRMLRRRPYDAARAFTALGQLTDTPFVYAVPASHPADNLQDFIVWANKKGPAARFASGGAGSIAHLNGELMNQWAGLRMTHAPSPGSPAALADLAAGRTHLLVDTGAALKPLLRDGRLRAIAIGGAARDADLPDVPTLREIGFQALETSDFQGLVGPTRMPRPAAERLSAALARALAQPEVREAFARAGTPVAARTPQEFAELLRSQDKRWAALIRTGGIRAH